MNNESRNATTAEPFARGDQQIIDINEAWILALKAQGVPVRIIERCHLTVQDAIDNNMDADPDQ